MLKVFVDGSCRANGTDKAVCGIGFVIKSANKIIGNYAFLLEGYTTNNEAEYRALIEALKIMDKYYAASKFTVYSDSKLVVNQVNGKWKVKKEELKHLCQYSKDLLKYYKATLKWIPREKNKEADKLAQSITEDK